MSSKISRTHNGAAEWMLSFRYRHHMQLSLAISYLLIVCLQMPLLSAQSQNDEETTHSFKWRAISLDLVERHRPGDDPARGYIPDVHVNGVEESIHIPFAKPTQRQQHRGPKEITFYRPPVTPDSSPLILAQNPVPSDIEQALVFFWPNRTNGAPDYRLLFFHDPEPQPEKRLMHLINFTANELFIGVEDQQFRLQPLQSHLVECRSDSSNRSHFIIFRAPEDHLPARRLVSTSYRIPQGGLLTLLILPQPGTATPSLQVFRDQFQGEDQ